MKSIPELPSASLPLTGDELLVAEQAGETVAVAVLQLVNAVLASADPANTAATLLATHESNFDHSLIEHTNRAALNNVQGVNTGDQDLDAWFAANHAGLAALAGATSPSSWVPSDVSGGLLTFTAVTCNYVKVGKLVFLAGQFTFPTNSDTTNFAKVGGLPANPLQNHSCIEFCANASTVNASVVANTGGFLQFYNNLGSSTPKKNSDMSGVTINFNMVYISV